MTFAYPNFLYLLLAAPVLVALKVLADLRGGKAIKDLAAPRLRHMLVVGVSSRRSWLIFSLQLAALVFFILALAGPRWGEETTPQKESGRNVLIAIDCSRSMLANDIAPDRITRAQLAAQDLLATLRSDRVGLIAFAGTAYLQAPLTTDHEAVLESIQALDSSTIPRGGSEISRALKLAMETFEKSPARNHGLILFSDGGEPNSQITRYAQEAAKKNILILTVGVGNESGALIPDPDPERAGDYVRDQGGNVVNTRLESGVLQEIATTTRGRYLKLGSQPLADTVVKELFALLQAQTNEARESVKPIERFYVPLSIGIVLLMIAWFIRPSFRRRQAPVVALAALAFIAAPDSAQAGIGSSFFASLFSKGPTPGSAHEAFERGDFEEAEKQYTELVKQAPAEPHFAYGLGAAAFQRKDYDRAVNAFSQALESRNSTTQLRAHRGMAHSLYDQGDNALAKQPRFTLKAWRDALRHFDAAIKIDPANKDIKENREFVKKRLDQLQQQVDQQDQQKKNQKGKKKDKQKGQKGDGSEGQEEGEEGEGEDEDRSRKESLAKQQEGEGEKEEEVPEGELAADDKGQEEQVGKEENGQEGDDGDERQEWGFSRNEARAFLRSFADDQKKALLLRPRDEPVNGKDW